VIYPAGQIDEAMVQGIGTGLYRLRSFEPGQHMRACRIRDHYKGAEAGFFDEIEFIAINEPSARQNALLSGRVDVINGVDPRAVGLLQANPGVRVQEVGANQHYAFTMQTGSAPFHDANIRKALKYGIDRQQILDTVLRGHGMVASDSPIGPANPYFHAGLTPPVYDPDQARFWLRQAGLSSLNVDLGITGTELHGAVEMAKLFEQGAAAAGMMLNLVDRSAESFRASLWAGRATEDWMFSTAYQQGAPWNESRWDHERFQSLLFAARAELDSDRRRAMYHEMQEILRDDGGVIIPVFASYLQALNDRIGTPETPGNLWSMDDARMAERWWIA